MVQLLSKMATYLLLSDKGIVAVIDSGTTFSVVNLSRLTITNMPRGQKSRIMVTHIKMAYGVSIFDELYIIGCSGAYC